MKLKCDLHLHTNEDPKDFSLIKYNSKELIDYAAELGFQVLSITLHKRNCYRKELTDYARKKGILLISGCEAEIEGKHILLYNFTDNEFKQIKTIQDIKKFKREDNLVIAPHPYYFGKSCLRKKLEKHINIFDAIEYCHFYHRFFNFNKKAEETAGKYNKPLIGTSDSHKLWQINNTYSIINAKNQTIISVIKAIKENKTELKTKPLTIKQIIKTILFIFLE